MRYSSMWLLMCYSLPDFLYYLEGVAEASYTDDTIPYSANKTNDLCKKGNQKLNASARVVLYMCLEKRKTVMKAFAISQFGYCP